VALATVTLAGGCDDGKVPGLATPPLSVQTILHQHGPSDLDRFLHGLAAAVAVARREARLGSVGIAIGDCSPEPVIDSDRALSLGDQLGALGNSRFDYRFFGENLDSAGVHNALFGAFGGELVLIVNPDVYALPSLLGLIIERTGEPKTGIVEARQVPLEHSKAFGHDTGETSWASTACALVDGDGMSRLGGFGPQRFFLYCDDVDFSWRTRLGRRVIYEPTACVFHDKRLDRDGQVQAGVAEVYYSAEAALIMAWKYSRPNVADRRSEGLLTTGSPAHTRAVETFRQRQAVGRLPEQLDLQGNVAQFVGYAYAPHRFAFDDE
jgi:hypothetical protein